MYFVVVKILKWVTTHNLMSSVNILRQRKNKNSIVTYCRLSDSYLRIRYADFQAGARSRYTETFLKHTASL